MEPAFVKKVTLAINAKILVRLVVWMEIVTKMESAPVKMASGEKNVINHAQKDAWMVSATKKLGSAYVWTTFGEIPARMRDPTVSKLTKMAPVPNVIPAGKVSIVKMPAQKTVKMEFALINSSVTNVNQASMEKNVIKNVTLNAQLVMIANHAAPALQRNGESCAKMIVLKIAIIVIFSLQFVEVALHNIMVIFVKKSAIIAKVAAVNSLECVIRGVHPQNGVSNVINLAHLRVKVSQKIVID